LNSFQRKKETDTVHVQKYAILMIDAECLVVYRQFKGHNARTIYGRPVTRPHGKAPAYLSVTNWLQRLKLGDDWLDPGIHTDKRSAGLLDFKSLTDLTAFPFHRVRRLAGTLKTSPSTI
jgi:hypothetical protein